MRKGLFQESKSYLRRKSTGRHIWNIKGSNPCTIVLFTDGEDDMTDSWQNSVALFLKFKMLHLFHEGNSLLNIHQHNKGSITWTIDE